VICLIHNLLADTEIMVGADRDCLELELSCNRVEGMGTKCNGVERGRGPVTTRIEQVDNLLKDLCRKAHGDWWSTVKLGLPCRISIISKTLMFQ
jgi:hypothetical protein